MTEATFYGKAVEQDGRLDNYETRVEAIEVLGGLAPGDISDATVASIMAQAGSMVRVETGKHFVRKSELTLNVLDFGAKGDWKTGTGTGTDNHAAFAAAFNALVTMGGGKLYIPAGRYRFSAPWNIYRANSPRVDITLEGEDQFTTFLVADFYGADKALISCVDESNVTRSSPTNFRDFQCLTVSRSGGTNPAFIDIGGWGESRMDHIRFSSNNNTHFRASSLQNIVSNDVVSYYGGKNFLYKATDGVTFDVTTGGIITASADIFTINDVSRIFFISPSNTDQRIMYIITGVTDARTAIISSTTPAIAATGAKGTFDAARATMTAGSAQMTANSQCFTTDDIGRIVYVRNARQGAYGPAILRAKIIGLVSAATVTLDTAATISVTRSPFATPVFDLYTQTRKPYSAHPAPT